MSGTGGGGGIIIKNVATGEEISVPEHVWEELKAAHHHPHQHPPEPESE